MSPDVGSYLSTTHVAVIDDSRAFAAGLSALVRPYVASVTSYTDSKLAIESMTAQVPDLILTDLEMPGISGIELIKILRADPKFSTVPILMLTGKSNPATMGEAIHAGADSFMAKADIRTDIFPKLLALARTRTHYQNASRGMQLDAVKALIGTYKHEFGNAIAAIDGKLRKLERTVPSVAQDEAYLALKKWNARLIDTLGKLDQLRNYQEEQYVDSSKMMKVG